MRVASAAPRVSAWQRPRRRRGASRGQLTLFKLSEPQPKAEPAETADVRVVVPIGTEFDGLEIVGLSLAPRLGWSARLQDSDGAEYGCEGSTAAEALRGAYLLASPDAFMTREDCIKPAGQFLRLAGNTAALKVLGDELRFLRWTMRLR